jgi:streptogramin lyase
MRIAVTLVIMVVAAACTSSGTSTPTDTGPVTSTTLGEAQTTSPRDTTSTTQNPVTTPQPPTDTTIPTPQLFTYAVVAEERARRLAVIDPARPCLSDGATCDVAPVLTIELPQRPHNLTGAGSVVYATHPAAGSISRVDLATGDVLTVAVGTEPHDIKHAPTPGVLYVADEAGRKLLTVDPETLGVLASVELPAKAHDLALGDDAVWVTLVGRAELARVEGTDVELIPTGGSPHDLIIDESGLIWFSNWNSDVLNIFDPTDGTTVEAPAGVAEPHHFTVAPDGTVWVSDNGGAVVVGFTIGGPVTIEVGPVPHHVKFVGDTLVVAVSGTGEAVLINDGRVIARAGLTTGLHGVAVVELTGKLAALD